MHRAALEACMIPLDSIPREVAEQTLLELPAYAAEHDLPYGVAHDLTESAIGPALDALYGAQSSGE